ncbi:M1 family metallopeptidase [Clostridium sp. OS1-26]|uniref:M1 family metallopeptidase n=1 Tax=Clostridium sp. OS1-26 TaxID=3070681 RepID=UPI0027DFB72F|nr:M1 family metallopeptidase [Clostridium sp. OS1-26]WML33127.1 M1 family metallopeptidase [Clostridium sp. OS1-26]
MKKSHMKTAVTAFIAGLSMVCLFKGTTVQASSLPTKYDMNLEFNSEKKNLTGKEDVYISNNSGSDLKTLEFHLYADSYNKRETMPFYNSSMGDKPLSEQEKGDISIEKVIVNGKELSYTQDNELLKISLDKELKKGENLSISIQFNLKLPNGVSRLGYSNDVYSFTNWYPILSMYDSKENKWDENSFNTIGESNYSDISEYNVNIKVPKNFTVVSTGKEAETSSENNAKVMNLKAKDVRDFVMIMSPYFKSVSKEIDGIKVNSYYLDRESDSTLNTAEKVLDSSVDAVKFFSQQFGKYPYDDLDMVETYFQGGAMEYPQLVQMPKYPSSIKTPSMNKFYDMTPFIKQAAVHEVGHQWWYVTVGNNEFKEPFLDESLTSFSTAYFFDKTEGPYSEEGILSRLRAPFTTSREGAYGEMKIPPAGSSVDKYNNMMSYNISIYGKGALIFEDLRNRVGDAKFKEVMQSYFKEYKFKNSSIDGLLSIIEQKCGSAVKEAIKNAIYSDKYNPENLKVTDADLEKISVESLKSRITASESSKGLVLGSLFLRAAKGEKVIIVTPSSLNKTEQSSIDDNLKNYFRDLYGKILIKTDKDVTEKDLIDSNVMLIGNPQNNKLFNSLSQSLPVSINKSGLSSSGFTINNENISGFLVTKNPKDEKKAMGILFWTKDGPENLFLNPNMDSQFTISIDNKQLLNGDF